MGVIRKSVTFIVKPERVHSQVRPDCLDTPCNAARRRTDGSRDRPRLTNLGLWRRDIRYRRLENSSRQRRWHLQWGAIRGRRCPGDGLHPFKSGVAKTLELSTTNILKLYAVRPGGCRTVEVNWHTGTAARSAFQSAWQAGLLLRYRYPRRVRTG